MREHDDTGPGGGSSPFRSMVRNRPPRETPVGLIIGVIVLLLAGAAGWYWLRARDGDELVTPEPQAAWEPDPTPATPPAPTATTPLDLPELRASDEFVRGLVSRLSAHPQLAAWLVNDELIRRFVTAIANMAQGLSPAAHIRFAAPEEPFRVTGTDGSLRVDTTGYRRYDRLAATFASLDTEGTVRLYRQLYPLLDEAYQELGFPDATFDEALLRAISNLRSARVPPDPPALEPSPEVATDYIFADPDLETRSSTAKHLMRMGPANARRIQAKLTELEAMLAIAPP